MEYSLPFNLESLEVMFWKQRKGFLALSDFSKSKFTYDNDEETNAEFHSSKANGYIIPIIFTDYCRTIKKPKKENQGLI